MSSTGFITARDHFVIDFDRDELAIRMSDFADLEISDSEIRQRYFAGRGSDKYLDGNTRGWKLSKARKMVQRDSSWPTRIRKCLYRPFDERFVYWTTWMIDWPRPEVMGQMVAGDNLALITVRQVAEGVFNHVLVTESIVESRITLSNKGIAYLFPIYLYPDSANATLFDRQEPTDAPEGRRPNLNPDFISDLSGCLKLRFIPDERGDFSQTFGPEDVLHYTYAVFHSPTYRSRYAEFLKIDFPRLPLTSSLELFRALARLGGELVALHLMESPKLDRHLTTYIGPAHPQVEKVSYAREAAWLDKAQTRGFRGVPEAVWNFRIGGYQVCQKWLKDRGPKKGKPGRTLTPEDIEHYQRIVVALKETIRLMEEIDEVIEAHGGWPIE